MSQCQAWALIPQSSLHLCWTSSLRQIWRCHIFWDVPVSKARPVTSPADRSWTEPRRGGILIHQPTPRQAVINLHAQAKALVLNIYSICIQIRIPKKSTVGAKARAKKLFFSLLNILIGQKCGSSLSSGNGWEWGQCLVLLSETQRIPFSSESTDNGLAGLKT